jgi:hypothetical protein
MVYLLIFEFHASLTRRLTLIGSAAWYAPVSESTADARETTFVDKDIQHH